MAARPLITALIVAGVLLGAAVLIRTAQHSGVIDADLAGRAMQALIGLMVAFYGNFIPKNLGRARGIESERRLQPVLRASGWSFTLAGLAYAAISLFAPHDTAPVASMLVIAGAIAVTLAFVVRCFAARNAGNSSAE